MSQNLDLAKEHGTQDCGEKASWTDEQKSLIEHHLEYHRKMWLLLECLKKEGIRSTRGIAVPTEPTQDLGSLL